MADRSPATAGKLAISVVFLALLMQPSYAQQFPETERQKAQEDRERAREARKKADKEATDEAYKAMTERTRRVKRWIHGEVAAATKEERTVLDEHRVKTREIVQKAIIAHAPAPPSSRSVGKDLTCAFSHIGVNAPALGGMPLILFVIGIRIGHGASMLRCAVASGGQVVPTPGRCAYQTPVRESRQ